MLLNWKHNVTTTDKNLIPMKCLRKNKRLNEGVSREVGGGGNWDEKVFKIARNMFEGGKR